MKVIYSPAHILHRPPYEIFNGRQERHAEVPERIENICVSLKRHLGIKTSEPEDFSMEYITQVHNPDYVDYLQQSEASATEAYVYPSVFQYTHYDQKITNAIAKRGLYSYDLYTPINNVSFKSIYQSAFCALTAAQIVQKGERCAYALCRPPGHHAEKSRMGGYCYFNNAAVAAQYLSDRGKVAILDIDFHHGNGTQHIFYDRADVLTVSIHADPRVKFPFFSGFENEVGIDGGVGYNVNFPLELGTNDKEYNQVLHQSISRIMEYRPRYLLVCVGYDTHQDDPIGGFMLSTDYYTKVAKTIRDVNLPTVLIQEGGYNNEKLGDNAVAFVRGFL